ncbi:hypothetical protein NLI96_g1543 [Meripilus lineatus]|uniref:Protein FAF1 n=1 Tax=Meripilus lineatus TaxID=2056292 RepID=A0AAD5VCR1_9APHY|nr:hypothetical protein NLI96_g1543 [Physisporinus lineatus]
MSDSESTHNTDELLQLLEAHGKQFLDSFDIPQGKGKRKQLAVLANEKNKKRKLDRKAEDSDSDNSESDDEWTGFGHDEGYSDADPAGEPLSQNQILARRETEPNVVVFGGGIEGSSNMVSRRPQMKAFMSSKVSKLTQDDVEEDEEDDTQENDDLEMTNLQNDALLHRLVHTKLLSGSLNPDLDIKPSQRRKALAGRVLEVAGKAKLGKGETSVRAAERNKAAKHVRDGLITKQNDRNQKALETAKQMGNYHPALKQLYGTSSNPSNKKRVRGMKMGVGSFVGGVLKLSKREVASVQSAPTKSFNKRRR